MGTQCVTDEEAVNIERLTVPCECGATFNVPAIVGHDTEWRCERCGRWLRIFRWEVVFSANHFQGQTAVSMTASEMAQFFSNLHPETRLYFARTDWQDVNRRLVAFYLVQP